MGTRSLTKVYENGKPLLCLYRQLDGYPEGHGIDLADFLKDVPLVNGYSQKEGKRQFNGMGCLAAQMVAHFKKEVGNFYIMPTDTKNVGEEYVYTIKNEQENVFLIAHKIAEKKRKIFHGTAHQFIAKYAERRTYAR